MKLTKKEAQKIAEEYDLGKVKSFKPFSGGLVNYNYELKTEKGSFVVRMIGHKITKYKKQKLELEKNILLFLDRKDFPYNIPVPLQYKKNKYHSKIKGRTFWVYKMIQGGSPCLRNDATLREIAKALATYHKYIKNFKVDKSHKDIFSLKWLVDRYRKLTPKIEKMKPKNKTDKLFKENFNMFKDLTYEISKMNFKTNLIVVHGDINLENLLFKGNKLTAILDFDNLSIAPRVEDIAYSLRLSCANSSGIKKNKMNIYLKEYEKIHKLTKKEKNMIISLMIRSNCTVFWWMWVEMKKGQDKKYRMIKWSVDLTKSLIREWKK